MATNRQLAAAAVRYQPGSAALPYAGAPADALSLRGAAGALGPLAVFAMLAYLRLGACLGTKPARERRHGIVRARARLLRAFNPVPTASPDRGRAAGGLVGH